MTSISALDCVSIVAFNIFGFLCPEVMMMAYEVDKYREPIGRFSYPSKKIRVVDCPGLRVSATTMLIDKEIFSSW